MLAMVLIKYVFAKRRTYLRKLRVNKANPKIPKLIIIIIKKKNEPLCKNAHHQNLY